MKDENRIDSSARIRLPAQSIAFKVGDGDGEPMRLSLEEQMVSAKISIGGTPDRAEDEISATVEIGGRTLKGTVRPE